MTTDTTYVAGGLFEVVASTSSTEFRHDIVADGQTIAVHTITSGGAASTSYLHYDQLGSMDTITNATGSVIQSMSFDAFGNRRLANNWDYGVSQNTLATMNDYTNRGYTDQEQLDNLSLVDMNGRVYDPTVGRFISADPTVPAPLYSQAFNRYSYTYDSPLEYTDPSGFEPNWGLVGYGAVQVIGGYLTSDAGADLMAGSVATALGTGQLETLAALPFAANFIQVGMSQTYQGTENIVNGFEGQNDLASDPLASLYGDSAAETMEKLTLVYDFINDAAATSLVEIDKHITQKQAQKSSEPTSSATNGGGAGGGGGGAGIGGSGPDTLTFPSGCGCGSYTGPYESKGNSGTIRLAPVVVTGKDAD